MYTECRQIEGCGLNRNDLADHLSVERSSITGILARLDLEPVKGAFPWRRIWRCVHRTEGALLSGYLEEVRMCHPGSQLLANISTLEEALREPLMTFEEMALSLGKKPDTLAKAIRQGRFAPPFPTLTLGPRLRRYRRLEVTAWIEEGLVLDLPKAANMPARTTKVASPASSEQPSATILSRKALFGAFRGPGRGL